jgi:fatty acid desaturase
MKNSFTINKIQFWIHSLSYIGVFTIGVVNMRILIEYPILLVPLVLLATTNLHHLLNLVHIGTHMMIDKNRKINSIYGNLSGFFGGVTFADFRTTHLLHHRFLSDPQRDPDHFITTSGPWFTIPFKIFYHDIYFWRNNLWRQQNSWLSYLITRFFQILIISLIIVLGYKQIWIYLWLIPMLILGLLNGLFLFYLPHHAPKIEQKWQKNPNIFNLLPRLAIYISRSYHEKHHDNIRENHNYYPIFSSIKSFLSPTYPSKPDLHYKYTQTE